MLEPATQAGRLAISACIMSPKLRLVRAGLAELGLGSTIPSMLRILLRSAPRWWAGEWASWRTASQFEVTDHRPAPV